VFSTLVGVSCDDVLASTDIYRLFNARPKQEQLGLYNAFIPNKWLIRTKAPQQRRCFNVRNALLSGTTHHGSCPHGSFWIHVVQIVQIVRFAFHNLSQFVWSTIERWILHCTQAAVDCSWLPGYPCCYVDLADAVEHVDDVDVTPKSGELRNFSKGSSPVALPPLRRRLRTE